MSLKSDIEEMFIQIVNIKTNKDKYVQSYYFQSDGQTNYRCSLFEES